MRRETRHRSSGDGSRRLAGLSLIILLVLVLLGGPVSADSNDGGAPAHGAKGRLASDLSKTLETLSPGEVVRVIAQIRGDAARSVADRVDQLGGKVRRHLRQIDQMVLELPLDSVEALAETDGVEYLTPDREVSAVASHLDTTIGASQLFQTVNGVTVSGYDGTGVTVAVIDSGIDRNHVDLRDPTKGTRRVVLSMDFVGDGVVDDPFGHGTHVAGIIAGDGGASLVAGRDYTGVAPGANLLNFRVLDGRGHGYISAVISAIDLAIGTRGYYGTRIINLSLAAPPIDSYRNDPVCQAVARATAAGLVVVASAGNFGMDQYGHEVYGGITSPGISPAAITVGATDTRWTDVRSDDRIAPYSSRGPTLSHSTDPLTGVVTYDDLIKPDLVAPGHRIISLERYRNLIVTAYPALHVDTGNDVNNKSRYMILYGTSMSAGVVSGAAALMLQANPGLTPNMVKAALMYSAQIMEGPNLFEQGSGMLNVEGAVRLAKGLSPYAYALAPGQPLAPVGLPAPQSTIAGESCAWSQSLIWGGGELSGSALFTTQQAAYSQTLIWGFDAASWGPGVTYTGGLFSNDYVVFGKGGQWVYLTPGPESTLSSGLIWRDALYATGAAWQNQIISNDFFNVGSTSLIWGYDGYGLTDQSLIWGGFRLSVLSLIWGF